ncbi:MAG: hypothetical protein H8D67_23725 [Deltaproteobacteria bacterium]|nr:hypothetical protein [Deltaproteobacteria bacterium]MBL7113475.1 hypothetical protein [Bacteroidales bacterium]
MKVIRNIISLMLIVLPAGLLGQYVEIKAELDTHYITIGDQFHMNLYVSQPAEIFVHFPVLADTLIKEIEILSASPVDTFIQEDGQLILNQDLLLTCFDSGLFEIPPITFGLESATWSDSLKTHPQYLAVLTVPVDTAIRDIKQPIHVPVGFIEVFPWVLVGLGVLIIVAGIIYYIRQRKLNKPVFKVVKPEEPAHVLALRELDKLKMEKLWQKNDYKQYYTRLTEIIRIYLEKRYQIPAMEETSHEILEDWKQHRGAIPDLYDHLRQLLNLADLVKFAKEKPLPSDNEVNLDNAYEFVMRTKPAINLSGTEFIEEEVGTQKMID